MWGFILKYRALLPIPTHSYLNLRSSVSICGSKRLFARDTGKIGPFSTRREENGEKRRRLCMETGMPIPTHSYLNLRSTVSICGSKRLFARGTGEIGLFPRYRKKSSASIPGGNVCFKTLLSSEIPSSNSSSLIALATPSIGNRSLFLSQILEKIV
jgi:hypothetical protein